MNASNYMAAVSWYIITEWHGPLLWPLQENGRSAQIMEPEQFSRNNRRQGGREGWNSVMFIEVPSTFVQARMLLAPYLLPPGPGESASSGELLAKWLAVIGFVRVCQIAGLWWRVATLPWCQPAFSLWRAPIAYSWLLKNSQSKDSYNKLLEVSRALHVFSHFLCTLPARFQLAAVCEGFTPPPPLSAPSH